MMPEQAMDGQLSVSLMSFSGCAVLALTGESDMSVVGRWRDELTRLTAAGGPRQVVVDVSRLRFMDARAVAVLLEAEETLTARGASLAVAGARGKVARMLELTAAGQRIPLYVSVRQAIRGQCRGGCNAKVFVPAIAAVAVDQPAGGNRDADQADKDLERP